VPDFLITGMVFGLSAGFAPGPLLALVISETLQHGVLAGVRVALAPIVTDLPIILLSVFFASTIASVKPLLGLVSLTGGLFILYTGLESIRTKPLSPPAASKTPLSLLKGVLANMLSPHPYLFWIAVGTPTMGMALKIGPPAVVAFISGFYLCLIGSKVFLAIVAGRSRSFFPEELISTQSD